jgi:hypothetical protein
MYPIPMRSLAPARSAECRTPDGTRYGTARALAATDVLLRNARREKEQGDAGMIVLATKDQGMECR